MEFDHGLNKAISKIRDALGDSAENPRFIETVARRGYRFLADVASSATSCGRPWLAILPSVGDPGPADVTDAGTSSRAAARCSCLEAFRLRVGPGACSRLVVGFLSLESLSPTIRSLAVLPLENLSGDASQDYFADGMTDELITDLGQISALRVISRTSVMTYKSVRKPLPEIARELNVEAVVEGSVLRSGERVRITAQLIEVPAEQAHVGPEL